MLLCHLASDQNVVMFGKSRNYQVFLFAIVFCLSWFIICPGFWCLILLNCMLTTNTTILLSYIAIDWSETLQITNDQLHATLKIVSFFHMCVFYAVLRTSTNLSISVTYTMLREQCNYTSMHLGAHRLNVLG